MKILRILVGVLLANVAIISASSASGFDGMDSLSVMAKADSSGFRLRLAPRFHIGDAQIKTVIGNVGSDSDAYMTFRLREQFTLILKIKYDREQLIATQKVRLL